MEDENRSALILFDTQNLYYSARYLYGDGARIDFRKLKEVIQTSYDIHLLKPVCFVPSFKDNNGNFISFLKRTGYLVQQFEGNIVDAMKPYLEHEAPKYDMLFVGSGVGELQEFYTKLNDECEVHVVSFPDSLKVGTEELAKVVYLDCEVLMEPRKNHESFKTSTEEPSEDSDIT